jgi:hypothetical protein
MTRLIRIILTIVLLYFIYGETGWATTTFAALVAISFELFSYSINKIIVALKRQDADKWR